MIELVRPLEQTSFERSTLEAARLHRRLTVEETARRSGLTPDQVTWLEEGRVYRFRSTDDALACAVLLTAGLGIGRHEARRLAGLTMLPRVLDVDQRARLVVVAALSAALMALLAFVVVPAIRPPQAKVDPFIAQAAKLPPPWKISVDVLNGAGDINKTRELASRIQSLAYTVKHVRRADRFDYPQTAVYFAPGGKLVAVRLARQLGVTTKPLPGGDDPNRLVVIAGPARGPG